MAFASLGAFHLREIPEILLQNQMEHALISVMLFRKFRTISRGCPQTNGMKITQTGLKSFRLLNRTD